MHILVLIFGLSIFANAQKAILTGTIYDRQGAIIPNVSVKVIAKSSKQYEVKTDDNGVYEVKITTGIYTVECSAHGFKSFKMKNYFVPLSYKGKVFLDIALKDLGLVDF